MWPIESRFQMQAFPRMTQFADRLEERYARVDIASTSTLDVLRNRIQIALRISPPLRQIEGHNHERIGGDSTMAFPSLRA